MVRSQPERISNNISDLLDIPEGQFSSAKRAVASNIAKAEERYRTVHANQFVPTSAVKEWFTDSPRPGFQDAFRRATDYLIDKYGPETARDMIGDPRGLPFELVDQIKKEIDFNAGWRTSSAGQRVQAANTEAASRMAEDWLNTVDPHLSGYARTRQMWQGSKHMNNMLQAGKKALGGDFDDILANFQELSESDKHLFRIGLSQGMRNLVNKAGATSDSAMALLKNPEIGKRIKALTGSDEHYDEFVAALTDESRMFNQVKGMTKPGPAGKGTLMGVDLNSFGDALTGIVQGASGNKMSKRTADRILRMMREGDSAAVARTMKRGMVRRTLEKAAETLPPEGRRAILNALAQMSAEHRVTD